MLESVFGNKTASWILLSLFHYGELHASVMAQLGDISLTAILNQLNRLEKGGILVSKSIGRSRVYSLNPKSPYRKSIKNILEIAYESMPLKERQKLFKNRLRPRRKGKPVISHERT